MHVAVALQMLKLLYSSILHYLHTNTHTKRVNRAVPLTVQYHLPCNTTHRPPHAHASSPSSPPLPDLPIPATSIDRQWTAHRRLLPSLLPSPPSLPICPFTALYTLSHPIPYTPSKTYSPIHLPSRTPYINPLLAHPLYQSPNTTYTPHRSAAQRSG